MIHHVIVDDTLSSKILCVLIFHKQMFVDTESTLDLSMIKW